MMVYIGDNKLRTIETILALELNTVRMNNWPLGCFAHF